MSDERVMLLIDADNVSIDVMEQAIKLLLNQHGGLHVRRAYCTAESAVKHQTAFKRMAIKPMVNLAAGKNSTDIALAVDAIDLVLAERPDVVVIASSDSDFAPLVQRLREKGCVVRGIGQKGKTGDETQDVYDDYTVLEHHKSAAAAPPADGGSGGTRGARKTTARKAPARKTAAAQAKTETAAEAEAEAPARKTAARKATAKQATAKQAPAKKAATKTPARKAARPAPAPEPSAPPPAPAPAELSPQAEAVLACLPELAAGQPLALNVAVQRLRGAQLLGKNTSSLKLFKLLGERFELVPAGKPTQVRLAR